MKILFEMVPSTASQPKHSSRFDIDRNLAPVVSDGKDVVYAASPIDLSKFKPSFYIPRPFAERAKRIRITIEEI